jgi:large subunit ribosomal protein L23
MSRAPAEVIFGPLITERSYLLYQQGRYSFRVAMDASKPEIAHAIEEQYEPQGIKVVKVNTLHMRGKSRRPIRRGAPTGKTADWKKAIVTLQPGQRLEGLFGGV